MGVQTSLTNFRGRVKFTRVVDATLINAVAERHCQVCAPASTTATPEELTSEEADDILLKEKATPELLLLTGTAGIPPVEHVQAILQHILPKAPMSSSPRVWKLVRTIAVVPTRRGCWFAAKLVERLLATRKRRWVAAKLVEWLLATRKRRWVAAKLVERFLATRKRHWV
jgi:predicted nucleic acid-binding Zn ribbon protein